MGFFEAHFNINGEGEHSVCCPFPHIKADGTPYHDHVPSMNINLDKRVYKCMSCGASGNEIQMVQHLFHTTTPKATKFVSMLRRGYVVDDVVELYETPTEEALEFTQSLGISNDVLSDLLVSVERVDRHWEISLPVLYNNAVVDVRTYRPNCTPKVLSENGAPSGLVLPIKALRTNKWLLLCAGEKDMLVARSLGANACTLTGGELSTPLNPEWFKDLNVAIIYDNDNAGRQGALRVADCISPYTKDCRVVTKFHKDFPTEDSKEDFTDWVMKYGHNLQEMIQYIQDTEPYTPAVEEPVETIPLVPLSQAVMPEHDKDILRSNIQILTVSDQIYRVPYDVQLVKIAQEGRENSIPTGTTYGWELMQNLPSLFSMIGKPLSKQREICLRDTLHKQEKGFGMQILEWSNCYICQVSNLDSTYNNMTELTAYFVGVRPVQGGRYTITYQVQTDPDRGVVGIIVSDMQDAIDDIKSFKLDSTAKANLMYAQHVEGDVYDKVDFRAKAVRGILGYECDLNLIKCIDLSFNTVPKFNYGSNKNVRGYMDNLIIGESRVGKSDTAKKLRDTYNLGTFCSLAGSAATLAGLVGGTVKDSVGRMSTRAGIIPRSNEGLLIFEELAKADSSILKSLTDVRSSGLARITRVSGTIEMPASARMITLSNCRALANGQTRAIKEYSSGVEIVTDLIGTSEDIARYDVIYIADCSNIEADPLYDAPEAYPAEVLQTCIRWVWSRTPEQIKFADRSDYLIQAKSKELNAEYPLHIKLFGTECWKKLARLSIACAAYCVSSDETYENIVVKPEHVEWAYHYLIDIYDNDVFRLANEVKFHKVREQPNEQDTEVLQKYYIKYSLALDKLYQLSKMDKGTFKDIAGIDTQELAPIMKVLVGRDFVTADRNNMYITMKFRNTYNLLDKEHIEVARI